MLDPTRYSLDAATVGFRKRMNLDVDFDAFKIAMQTQNESVKVRRELEETPFNEIHVMGGEQFGYAGNSKYNETARQERQMNGYPLRSFLATGGPLVVPSKRSDPLLATQGTMGHSVFVINSADMGESTSAFTEPLYGALDSNAMAMGRSGLEAMSESIGNPYQKLQFMLNMHESNLKIQENKDKFNEIRGYNKQQDIKTVVDQLNKGLAKGESKRQYLERKRKQAEEEAGPNEIEEMQAQEEEEEKTDGGPRIRQINSAVKPKAHFGEFTPKTPSGSGASVAKSIRSAQKQIEFLDDDEFNIPEKVEKGVFQSAMLLASPTLNKKNVNLSMGAPGFMVPRGQQGQGHEARMARAAVEGRKNAAERAELIGAVPEQPRPTEKLVYGSEKKKKMSIQDLRKQAELERLRTIKQGGETEEGMLRETTLSKISSGVKLKKVPKK